MKFFDETLKSPHLNEKSSFLVNFNTEKNKHLAKS